MVKTVLEKRLRAAGWVFADAPARVELPLTVVTPEAVRDEMKVFEPFTANATRETVEFNFGPTKGTKCH